MKTIKKLNVTELKIDEMDKVFGGHSEFVFGFPGGQVNDFGPDILGRPDWKVQWYKKPGVWVDWKI